MLDNLKLLLGIEDAELDDKLTLLINFAESRLKRLIGGIEPPAELEDIIVEVAAKRFNRIGSEGMTSHSVEGESLTFSDADFAEYADEIQAFLNKQKDNARGKVRFI